MANTNRTIADAIIQNVNNGQVGETEVLAALAAAGVNTPAKPAIAALAMPTASAGGTANGAYQTVSQSTAAASGADTATLPTKTSVDLAIDALKNNFQELNVTVTAILAALKA